MIELVAALGLLLAALLPVAFSFAAEKKLARSQYQRAVAMEIVDGEFEVLAAGEWRSYGPGTHDYRVSMRSATNLPQGSFTLTIDNHRLRLEWIPIAKMHGGSVVREVKFK